MGKRCDVSIEKRTQAVLALLRREEPAAAIARRLGVAEQSLYRWRDQFLDGGKAALASPRGKADPRDATIHELKKDLSERELVIGELTVANRILKKLSDGSL